MRDLVPWTLLEYFESKIKENKKVFASNLTRLEIETDRYIKNVVFATSFSLSHLIADEKRRLRMSLTLNPV